MCIAHIWIALNFRSLQEFESNNLELKMNFRWIYESSDQTIMEKGFLTKAILRTQALVRQMGRPNGSSREH